MCAKCFEDGDDGSIHVVCHHPGCGAVSKDRRSINNAILIAKRQKFAWKGGHWLCTVHAPAGPSGDVAAVAQAEARAEAAEARLRDLEAQLRLARGSDDPVKPQ